MERFKNIIKFYIVYVVVLFIPINSKDKYYAYDFPLDIFLNKNILIGLSILLILTNIKVFIENKEYLITLLLSIFCVSWNILLNKYGANVDYEYFGFILLVFPAFKNLKVFDIKQVLGLITIILFSYLILSVISPLFSFELPLRNIRYESLVSSSGEIRLTFPLTYGQSNAAGSVLLLIFILNIILSKGKKLDITLIVISFLMIILSRSATSIFLSLIFFGLSYKHLLKKKKYLIGIIIIFGISFSFINKMLLNLYYSNSSSFFTKISRISSFFSNQNILLFGNNAFNKNVFYVESSFLDFWLNFGFIGVLIFLILLMEFVMNSGKKYIHVWIIIFSLTILQNSSLLVPNLLLIGILNKLTSLQNSNNVRYLSIK